MRGQRSIAEARAIRRAEAADDLRQRVQEALETKTEKIVLIKGDEDAPYSAIMATMDKLREAQIENIGLVTERRVSRAGGGGQ
jgi:biopolymer transport protein ExbD